MTKVKEKESSKVKKRKSDEDKIKMNIFKDIKKNPFSYSLLLPSLLYVFIFSYLSYPYMIIAFREFDYQAGPLGGDFVGFKNFEFFFKTNAAATVTLNTLKLNFLFILFGTLAAIIVSLMMNEPEKKMVRKNISIYYIIAAFSFVGCRWFYDVFVFLNGLRITEQVFGKPRS